jgi:hypothetical protein
MYTWCQQQSRVLEALKKFRGPGERAGCTRRPPVVAVARQDASGRTLEEG